MAGLECNLAFLPLVYGIGLEFVQALDITNGTFDVKDMIVVSIFWMAGFVYLKHIPAQIKNHSMSSKYIVASYLILFFADTLV